MKAFRINPQELIGGLALLGFGGAGHQQGSRRQGCKGFHAAPPGGPAR